MGTINGGHPYELDQIENLNKIDQAKYLATQMETMINEPDAINDELEKKTAKNNLKCL